MTQAIPSTPQNVQFDPRQALTLYLSGQRDQVCEQFLAVLRHLQSNTLYNIDAQQTVFINQFVKTFLYIFTQPDFVLSDNYALQFIHLNQTIANVVAISSAGTTDPWLEILRDQPNNYTRILALYSARNSVHFDRKAMFDLHPQLAAVWYCVYACIYYGGLVNANVCENLKTHFAFDHPELAKTVIEAQELYFGPTYLDGKMDRVVKPRVNAAARAGAANIVVRNRPDPRSIAVISGYWSKTHSVYRTLHHYVNSLRPEYRLTLVKPFGPVPAAEEGFDRVVSLDVSGNTNWIEPLLDNDFQAVFFPDVGMTPQSIMLANMRLAPIQLMGTGHPVSTFESCVDYFISGQLVETPDHPEKNYSERLVLLPGLGAVHNRPLYSSQGRRKATDAMVVNCSWYSQKINAAFVNTIQRLLKQCARPVKLRLYIGASTMRANDHLPFVRDLWRQLPSENIEVYAGLDYATYMGLMQEADLAIDCYHFGGSNTVSDNLILRVPTVTWEGQFWYNRIGSQMNRLAGMEELIATSPDEYIAKALRLIHDDAYRAEARSKLAAADLENTVYSTTDAKYFRTAVDYLIANHERLKAQTDRQPIRIPV